MHHSLAAPLSGKAGWPSGLDTVTRIWRRPDARVCTYYVCACYMSVYVICVRIYYILYACVYIYIYIYIYIYMFFYTCDLPRLPFRVLCQPTRLPGSAPEARVRGGRTPPLCRARCPSSEGVTIQALAWGELPACAKQACPSWRESQQSPAGQRRRGTGYAQSAYEGFGFQRV